MDRRQGEYHEAWGHRFRWTEYHRTHAQHRAMKQSYDKLAEECLEIIDSKFSPGTGETAKLDSYTALREHRSDDPKLLKLWNEITTMPDWVDWDQIDRGQKVFYRYGLATTTGLAFQSLLGGTGASGDISETLSRTGGFNIKTARRRLLETMQFVLQVTDSLEGIKPGGVGFEAALRVRFLHARVRRKIMHLAAARPGYYDAAKSGIPISDADCISTIVSFSSALVWQSLPRQGIYLREQEVVDFIALWRLIALYLGTPHDEFATPQRAKASMESVLLYEFGPTTTSKLLARNIIRALENTPPTYASRSLIEVNTRWLNGNELADSLDIPKPSIYYWVLTAGQFGLLMVVTYVTRDFPVLDRLMMEITKHQLWEVVMSTKHAGLRRLTMFDLKYIPALEKGPDDDSDIAERSADVWLTADTKALCILLVLLLSAVLTLPIIFKVAMAIMR